MNSISSTVSPRTGAVDRAAQRLGAREQVIAIIAIAMAVKLAVCPMVGLGTNEAYAIASGRLMSLSYFDHPPLHFWLAHLCEYLFGEVAAARIPFILLGAATSWMMFAFTSKLFGERAGVWATLALNLSVFFNLVSGNWILPDGPLNFFLLATAYVLSPTARGDTLTTGRWALAGLLAGLAALSKYHAFFFLAGYLAFLLADKERRRVLLTSGPWIAAVAALAVFSPVLIWNEANHWASLRFQGGRAVPHHLGIGLFFSLLSAQCAVLLPLALPALVMGTAKAMKSRTPDEQFLLWLGLPMVILFTFVPLFADDGMMHWSMPGWLLLMPLAGQYLSEAATQARWPRRLALTAAVLMIATTIAAGFEFQNAWLGTTFPHLFKRNDPTADNTDWTLTPIISAKADRQDSVVMTTGWRDAAKVDQALRGKQRVIVASPDPRNFAVDLDPAQYENHDGWIVLRAPYPLTMARNIRACFEHSAYVTDEIVARTERPDARLAIFRAYRFHAGRCHLVAFQN
jgi:positive regulator of sigma E activity